MLKVNRKNYILSKLKEHDYVKVSDLQEELNVTEMTIRRDLHELENEGLIQRVHGGAKSIQSVGYMDLKHMARKQYNEDAKRMIAKKAASLIENGDVVFISASTTNEFIHEYIQAKDVRIVTNCLYIYFQYREDSRFEVILIGGKYDDKIESFLGALTNDWITNMKFTRAFIGTNGIYKNQLSASNDEEGLLHRIALENAHYKYIVSDSSKFNYESFYIFFRCKDITAIITDTITDQIREEYSKLTKII